LLFLPRCLLRQYEEAEGIYPHPEVISIFITAGM
jgi:hypothetical protein